MRDIEKYLDLVFLIFTQIVDLIIFQKENIKVIDIWSQLEGENIFLSLRDLIYKKFK